MSSLLFDYLSSSLLPVTTQSEARAAIILLLSHGEDPQLLYTKRASHLRNHPGEVCFPGGMRDPEDVNLLATALREMEEEIGLPASEVQVLGCLPEVRTRAGTLVLPFVATSKGDYPLVPSLEELDSIFHVPLSRFEQGIIARVDTFMRDGLSYRIPVYHYQGYEIWGLTAAVTTALLQLLKSTPR